MGLRDATAARCDPAVIKICRDTFDVTPRDERLCDLTKNLQSSPAGAAMRREASLKDVTADV